MQPTCGSLQLTNAFSKQYELKNTDYITLLTPPHTYSPKCRIPRPTTGACPPRQFANCWLHLCYTNHHSGVDGICGSGQSGTVKNGCVENAGVDILSARYGKGGHCGNGQCGTIWQGWTLQEWTMWHHCGKSGQCRRKKRVQISSTETVLYYRLCTPTQNKDHETKSNKQVLKVTLKLLHIIT